MKNIQNIKLHSKDNEFQVIVEEYQIKPLSQCMDIISTLSIVKGYHE